MVEQLTAASELGAVGRSVAIRLVVHDGGNCSGLGEHGPWISFKRGTLHLQH